MHVYSTFYSVNNLTANYEIPSWRAANVRQKITLYKSEANNFL